LENDKDISASARTQSTARKGGLLSWAVGHPARDAFVALIVISVAIRILIALNYSFVTYNDTAGYLYCAKCITHLDLRHYGGMRAPGYPALLALGGLNFDAAETVQLALGVAIGAMLFAIGMLQTGSPWFSFAVGVSHTVFFNGLFFEFDILSETAATFWLILSVFLFARMYFLDCYEPLSCVAFGVASAMAGLTRPMFYFLPVLYVIFLPGSLKDWAWYRSPRLFFSAPAFGMLLLWVLFNKVSVDYFGPTTLTGYHLMNHSGAFIELAPDRWALIRDIYLKYRAQQIAETGDQLMTIWAANSELLTRTGLRPPHLTKELTAVSIYLFTHHPVLYLHSVAAAWTEFWSVALYWKWSLMPVSLASSLASVWSPERTLLRSINVAFIATVAYGALSSVIRKMHFPRFDVFVAALVIATSVLQAVMERGENARYAISTQPLVIYLVFLVGWRIAASLPSTCHSEPRPGLGGQR